MQMPTWGGIALGIIGLWQLCSGFSHIVEAEESSTWPMVSGQIASSRVVTSHSSGPHGGGTSYSPKITYSYVVNGVTFTNSSITPGRFWNSASADAVTSLFRAGTQAPVYYAPSHADLSMLVPGLHLYNFGNFVLGAMFCTFGALFGLVPTRLQRYGQGGPSGTISFPPGSPANKIILAGIFLIIGEFTLMFYVCRS